MQSLLIAARGRHFSHLVYGLICSLIILFGLAGYLAVAGTADSKTNGSTTKQAAGSPPAATSDSASSPPSQVQNNSSVQGTPELQPVLHARNAAVTTCLPTVDELSHLAVDGQHTAMSIWNDADANDRMFESVVGLKYDSQYAPHGLSVVMASPNPVHKCDGATVQVRPSSLSCASIQKNLAPARNQLTDLKGMALLQSDPSMRIVLVPTSGNGCAVIGVGMYYAK